MFVRLADCTSMRLMLQAVSSLPAAAQTLPSSILLGAHLSLLPLVAPRVPSCPPSSHHTTATAGLLPCMPDSLPVEHVRSALLASLAGFVQRSNRQQLLHICRQLEAQLAGKDCAGAVEANHHNITVLDASQDDRPLGGLPNQEGSNSIAGERPRAVHLGVLLQALLVTLESVTGPKSTRLLGRFAESFAYRLLFILAELSAPSTACRPLSSSPGVIPPSLAPAADRAQSRSLAAWTLRCFESMAAREASFELPTSTISWMLQAATSLCQSAPATSSVHSYGKAPHADAAALLDCGLNDLPACAAAYSAACSLLCALVRHREPILRRIMSLMVPACRALLRQVLAWDLALQGRAASSTAAPWGGTAGFEKAVDPSAPSHSKAGTKAAASWTTENDWNGEKGSASGRSRSGAIRGKSYVELQSLVAGCAADLTRVYEALSEHCDTLGKYCFYLAADYITHAAAPTHPGYSNLMMQALAEEDSLASSLAASSSDTGAVLRRGAYGLMSCVTPGQLQHLHGAIARGTAGALRRSSLAELKKDYEKHHKYSGKV